MVKRLGGAQHHDIPQNTTHMNTPAATIDASRCPLCGQANHCAMEVERATGQPQPPCWCTQADFPPELLDRLPPAARRQACICPTCAGPAASG